MKAFRIVLAAALLCACTRTGVEECPGGPLHMSFRGTTETPTRTSLGSGYSVRWSTSDAVTLFSGTGAGSTFKVASTENDGLTATFTGLTPESSNGYYYALYPASDKARLVSSGGTVLCGISTVQKGVEGSFAPEAALSLASVKAGAEANDILHFRNAGALLSFTVPGNWITRVKIESRDGSVAMSGSANVSYNDGEPEVSPTTASKNYVEVTVPEGSIGKTYYAVVYPGSYSQGFYVSFYTSSNAFNRYTSQLPLELPRNGNVSLIRRNWGVADDRGTNTESGTELIAPVISSGGQSAPGAATISFSCSSGKRDTYKLYLRDAASFGAGTLAGTLETGSGKYGTFSYTFSSLTTGASYDLGVSASCAADPSYTDSPVTWLEDVTINASASAMTVSVESSAESYYNFVVNYSISGLKSAGAEHGLVFSYSNPTPTCGSEGAAGKLPGPVITASGDVQLCQCVPNAALRPGQKCWLRAYCYDDSAGNYVYSPVQQLTLAAQPAGYGIEKTALESPSDAISVFRFKADGRLDGVAAAADCSSGSPVRLGVHNASMGKTSAVSMQSQMSASGALVLVNGQIFGGQGNIGLAYTGGSLRYNNFSDDGIAACSGYANSYSGWQPVTRAILGVDASGRPCACWCTLSDGRALFFDRPIPAGTAVYPQAGTSTGPGPVQEWTPQEALSTGPMLLYGGNVCVSEDKVSTGVYYTNYELWETASGNIYGSSRQRTAIGYDSASGKVYLVVVTSNVTITALALVMKGLGCDYAMNLDGGGSTQMHVKGAGALTSNSRAVKSTVGFF